VVVVIRLDRLARSTRDLLNLLAELTDRGVGLRSIKDAGIDTTSATGQLVLQILASIGEFERKLIRSRVEDGTKRAWDRGVKFGRKPKLNPHQRQEAKARLQAGETQADVARSYGVDRSTICRLENV
jgi:DNA invertase Pin-like site-specific DNA recombinase